MLNPKHERYAKRLRELIDEGKAVARLERSSGSSFGPYIQGEDKIALQAWLASVASALESVFGSQAAHVRHFREVLPGGGIRLVEHDYEVYEIVGVLAGALDDLENGFLLTQELLLVGEIFDSVLEQARHLNSSGYKDPAAVLARVVLEDTLKRLARKEGLDVTQKASAINDELRTNGKYPQSQWRFIQAWLDIGNAAAHGNFGDYDQQGVTRMMDGIEQFLATIL